MSDIWSNAVQAHQEGNFRLAKQLYDRVIEDAKQAQDHDAFVIVLYHLARLALDYDQEGPEVALHRFKKLLRSQEKIGDSSGISKTLREIATIYEQQEQLVPAIRYGERALASAKEVFDQQQMAASYHLLGLLYQYAQLPSQSVTAMKEAQNQWEQLGNVIAWQNTTAVFVEILEEQENFPLCIRELRRLVKTLDNQEDMEDIASIHFRLATLFGRQGDFQNALIHMLACLLRNRELGSDLVQRDAMVLLDIRERIGIPEFDVILEKKMGSENAAYLLMWLDELFPPENSDPALQRIPEPESLAPEHNAGVHTSVPQPIEQNTQNRSEPRERKSQRDQRAQRDQRKSEPASNVRRERSTTPVSTPASRPPSPVSKPSRPNRTSDSRPPKPSIPQVQSVPSAFNLPPPPKQTRTTSDSAQYEDQSTQIDVDIPNRTSTSNPQVSTTSSTQQSTSHPQISVPVSVDEGPLLDVEEMFFDDKTEERERTPLHGSTPSPVPPPAVQKVPDELVNWDEESGELSQYTDTSLPNEWTQYTEPVQSMPEVPLPTLAQHFLAALLGAMGVLALLQWVL